MMDYLAPVAPAPPAMLAPLPGVRVPLRAHVMVATPCYTGSVAHEYCHSLQLETMLCLSKGVLLEPVYAAGFSLVQHARNWLNAEFLARPEFTHILWIDDDLGWAPGAILKLLDCDLDAVGGCYTTKSPKNPVYPYESLGPVVGSLQPVRKLPGGFLLLKRHVVEKVSASCERYLLDHNGETRESAHVFDLALVAAADRPGKLRLLGEDFVMAQRILEAGFGLYCYTDINFMHLGRHAWRGNLAKTLAEEAARGFTGQGSEAAHRKNTEA